LELEIWSFLGAWCFGLGALVPHSIENREELEDGGRCYDSEQIQEGVGKLIAPIDRDVLLQLASLGEIDVEDLTSEVCGKPGVGSRQVAFAIQAQAQ
jgi:hypothetical protein